MSILLVLVTLMPCLQATGDGLFGGQVIDVSSSPLELVVADVNGDLVPDVVTGHTAGQTTVAVLLGQGDGTLVLTHMFTGLDCWAVAAGDLDGNGRDNVLVNGQSLGAGTVHVLSGSVLGTLSLTETVAIPWEGRDVVVADADADGDLDAVTACLKGDAVVVLLNDGAGHLVAGAPVPAADGSWDLAAADYNVDGLLDLAVAGNESHEIAVLLGAGGGAFAPAPVFPLTSFYSAVEAGDFDEDGIADLALGYYYGYAVLVGAGDGTFVPGTVGVSGLSSAPTVADVDDDGHVDLCQVNPSLGQVEVHRGDGTGALPDTVLVPAEDDIRGVWTADLDLDGHTDLLTLDYVSGTLVVIEGSGCGVPATGVQLPGAFDVTSMRAADLSGDGHQDLLLGEAGGVRVLRGDSQGEFESVAAVAVGVPGAWVWPVLAGDLSGDGLLDVACSDYDTADIVLISGTGDGALGAPAVLADNINWLPDLALGDANADGLLDLLALDGYVSRLLVWRGKPGGGVMLPLTFPIGVNQGFLLLADFNEDGLLDASSVGIGLTLLPGAGSAVFGAGVPALAGTELLDPHGGDFDGDGHADLITQNSQVIGLVTGGGDGSFAAPKTVYVPWFYAPIRNVGDVDEDGADECIVDSSGGAIVYGHDGVGMVIESVSPLAGYTSAAVLADVDEDGDVDLVTGSYSGEGYSEDDHAIAIFPHIGPWFEAGPGLPGAAGWPALLGAGLPGSGGDVQLHLCHAARLAPTLLVVGLTPIGAPFKGGYLIPSPEIIVGPIAGTAEGELDLAFHWPPGVPAGLSLYLQAWLPDASGPAGFSASVGLMTTTR